MLSIGPITIAVVPGASRRLVASAVLEPLAEGGTNGQVPDLEAQFRRILCLDREWEPDGKPGYQLLLSWDCQK
jgi:hypothetical protein